MFLVQWPYRTNNNIVCQMSAFFIGLQFLQFASTKQAQIVRILQNLTPDNVSVFENAEWPTKV